MVAGIHTMARPASLKKSAARGRIAQKRGKFPLEIDLGEIMEILTASDTFAATLERNHSDYACHRAPP
jgi:hypothetical protein